MKTYRKVTTLTRQTRRGPNRFRVGVFKKHTPVFHGFSAFFEKPGPFKGKFSLKFTVFRLLFPLKNP